jgi:transposase
MDSIIKVYNYELLPVDRAFIWGLFTAGKSLRSISRETQVPYTTVHRTIDNIWKTRISGLDLYFISKPRSGRPKKLTDRANRRLYRHVRQHRKSHLLSLTTPSKSGCQIGLTLLSHTLHIGGYHRRRARKKPYISPINRKKRLAFIKANKETD